jgi:predicted ABC-type ATPase
MAETKEILLAPNGKPSNLTAEQYRLVRTPAFIEDHDEIYKKWRRLVNMSASEIEAFYKSDEGKEAGLSVEEAHKQGIHNGRQSARWIIKMKHTPKDEWTPEMWEWAKRQISFISRMSGNEGKLYDEKGRKTRKLTSLLIWGHNPEKYADGGEIDTDTTVPLQEEELSVIEDQQETKQPNNRKMLTKIKLGRKRDLNLPNGEKRQAQYAVVELDDLKASHNEETFANTEGYPLNEFGRNINDRNYAADVNAQKQVDDIAKNLIPENIIELTSKASGTPIINNEGIVVSGNNRTMSLKLAAKKYPQNYQNYKSFLKNDIDIFGIDESDLDDFKKPVLVRIDKNIKNLDTTELSKYNVDTKKGERPVDKAIKFSTILTENKILTSAILNIIDGYDKFSDLYADNSDARKDRSKLVNLLIQAGILTEMKLPEVYADGNFTEGGKDFIESILSSIVLTPDSIVLINQDGLKFLRNIIVSTLPVLITNSNLPEGGSLKKYLNEAISYQNEINASGGYFVSFLNSVQLFEQKHYDIKSVYLNRLLNVGVREFKRKLIEYNNSVKENSGTDIFGGSEKLSLKDIFIKTIAQGIPDKEREAIEKAYSIKQKNDVMSQIEMSIPKQEQIVEFIEETPQYKETDFYNDNWFIAHPDKLLGEAYETTGAFGKVTKYKGTIDVLNTIDVPLNFIGNLHVENPLDSSAGDLNISAISSAPSIDEIIQNATLEVANNLVKAKQSRKVKKEAKIVEKNANFSNENIELQTFEEVFERYNSEETKADVAVFVWYKSQIGKPLSKRWVKLCPKGIFLEDVSNLADNFNTPVSVSNDQITNWVKAGKLYYINGILEPEFIYLSGNIWEKKFAIERDKSHIIETYGEDVLNAQLENLEHVFKVKYDRRLTLTGDNQTGLALKPISKFADTFMIKRLDDMGEDGQFAIAMVTARSKSNYGKPDWAKDMMSYSDRDREVVEELSIKEAFCYWLLRSKPELKESVSHYDIVKVYVQQNPTRLKTEGLDAIQIKKAEAAIERQKASCQKEGERLFAVFLESQLTANDKVRLETMWNSQYNNYVSVNFDKVPVAFTMCKNYKGKFEELKSEKKEAVANILMNGTGCLAFDVGVGKTPSAIFTISAFIDAGYCKRPFICVPNQVYKQFISEIKNFAPHIMVNEAYNLGVDYAENFKGADGKIQQVHEGSITVMTYEGLELIGFNQTTRESLMDELYEILNQGGESDRQKSSKQIEGFREKLEKLLGRGMEGTIYNIEDFGFDFGCYDEAHKMKKIFTAVKGEVTENSEGKQSRNKSPYVINSGTPSSIGLKGFMLNQYILKRNNYQNVLLLTATPFTNSPLEIFSMLSMLAYEQLKSTDLNNIKSFFDTYIATSTELVIDAKLRPVFKQVILGFNNLVSLQTLIRRYINYKMGDEIESIRKKRPVKYVLPYKKKVSTDTIIELSEAEIVDTTIEMTPAQKSMMNDITAYVEGKISQFELQSSNVVAEILEDSENEITSQETEVDESDMGNDDKLAIRILKGLSFARNLALSPYLYVHSGMSNPDYKQYVMSSPKLQYVMGCIKSVKQYHEKTGTPISGQVIYMDRGIQYFNLLKEFLVNDVGFQPHEIGIIVSGLPEKGKRSKEYIKNLFNGEIYNENSKELVPVTDAERIKVIIGSSTIKEGMNLQKYGTCLYNCFLDWNPTDIQQLEGRIFRQGNTYKAVRIVNPLVVDSADIFIFQKLEEKTSRLNSIWSLDNKATSLNTQEFDPHELKYQLIRDPRIVAELKLIDQKNKVQGEKIALSGQKEKIDILKDNADTINRKYDEVTKLVLKYRDFNESDDKFADAAKLADMIKNIEKTQKDKEGKTMARSWERDIRWNDDEETREKKRNFSPLDAFYPPYWFSDYSVAIRDIKRAIKEFIVPYGIPFKLDDIPSLDTYVAGLDQKIKDIEEYEKSLESEQMISEVMRQVVEEREQNKVEFKTLERLIGEFSSMNYLLDKEMVFATKLEATPVLTCPPVLSDGTPDISDKAIEYLEECVSKLDQTKKDYSFNDVYIPERHTLHEKIIATLMEHVSCVKSEKPIAVFTGGATASGKSTFLKKNADWLLSDKIFHIDSDEIRAMLPEYKGWNATATNEETKDIVNELLNFVGAESCKYDIVYDGTINKAKKYFPLVQKVKDMGYLTYIIFMDIPYSASIQRMKERYKRSGRYVPVEVINEFFEKQPNGLSKGRDAFNQLKEIVDGYMVVDGITGEVKERGGMKLPADRTYSGTLTEKLTVVSEPIETPDAIIEAAMSAKKDMDELVNEPEAERNEAIENSDNVVAERLEMLKMTLEFSDDDAEKEQIRERIEMLEMTLEFS